MVFGGVLASQGQVSLGLVLGLAVVGAIAGDAVGYGVGRRYGRRLQTSTLGRWVGDERWSTTEAFLIRRGGTAVFLGRWTALLRAMVPSAAGMAGLPFRVFLLWNVLGGALWAAACVVGGYVLGDVIGRFVSGLGYVIGGVVVVAVLYHYAGKWREKRRERATSDPSGR